MAPYPWILCAVSGFVACGIIWLALAQPELIVNPDRDRTADVIVYLIGRDPWAFPIAMAVLGRFAVHILFEVKAAPESFSSRAGAKPRTEKDAYLSSESQRLWAFRSVNLSAIIPVMVILCFDNLSTRFPPTTLERYIWVWAIFGPGLPFLTLSFFIPIMEILRWRCQRARLGMDHVDVEKGYSENSDEDEDYDDDGATADTEKQQAATNDDRDNDKHHDQNTSRYSTRYSNSEKDWTLILVGLSTFISILVGTGFLIFIRDLPARTIDQYMWICLFFGPPFLPCSTFFFAILYLEWSRWRRLRAQQEIGQMDAEEAYAAYTDDEVKVDEKESGLES
ncbi:hypothetical protein PG984_000304 [Apiospora sp. TS-2023a]